MTGARFSLRRAIAAGLRHHVRMHIAVALGVLAGTAVLTGALLVGDSMRGSLVQLTLDRLGPVHVALAGDRYFRAALADELAASAGFSETFEAALPVLMLPATLEKPRPKRIANRVQIVAGTPACWAAWGLSPEQGPGPDEIVLNEHVAAALEVQVGEQVVARLPRHGEIPPDSALGKKRDAVVNKRWKVKAIVPASGLGRFGLHPSQRHALNALVRLADLQAGIERPGQANTILVTRSADAPPTTPAEEAALQSMLRPTLADYGLSISRTSKGYFQLASERMLLDPATEETALAAYSDLGPQPVLVYLANWIEAGAGPKGKIPYSTLAAVDFGGDPRWQPLATTDGAPIPPLADDEIVLNRWAADDLERQGLEVRPGDPVSLTFFEPESVHGAILERQATFRLAAVAALHDAAGKPTVANDRDFTPELRGVTDKESIDRWDAPFPFDASRVRSIPPHDEDERYWDLYGATPKAFVSLAAGRRLWQSRFGRTTSIRIPAESQTAESLAARLRIDPAAAGFVLRPLRRLGLESAAGTTPFDGLFLGFSFFLIASASMLVALLFRLSIERRGREIGILVAAGWPARRIRAWLLGETAATACLAAAAGAGAGVGYAWLMIAGLRTWWVAAVSTPFLQLHVSPQSLVFGAAGGLATSLGAAAWSLRSVLKASPRALLASQSVDEVPFVSQGRGWAPGLAVATLLLAVACTGGAMFLQDEAQAGAFFGAGAMTLCALLLTLGIRLRAMSGRALIVRGGFPLARLAARNAARRPGRSTLTIGLMASATFSIVALGAFRLDPPERLDDRTAGSGGFTLWAESDLPLYHDLDSPVDRVEQLNFSESDASALAGTTAYALRVRPGDDASCLNLYQPTRPRVLGVPHALIERGGFAWSGVLAPTPAERENPWQALERALPPDADGREVLPVVLDANTATYSLKWGLGGMYDLDDGRGGRLRLQVVGLLKNSVLQGDLLLAEDAFRRSFPEVNGFRLFLVETPPDNAAKLATVMETALGDYGFDATGVDVRLRAFMAVQNTYLSTFQTLGGLGLLLGAAGLAVVQLRNVLERRGELALLRAIGFRPARLAAMVVLENAWLLCSGLLAGAGAALVATWPHLWGGRAALPWGELAITLAAVALTGMLSGLAAVRAALRSPLLPALRGE